MDQGRFDAFTRSLAAVPSRRRFLKGAAAVLVAAVFGGVPDLDEAEAASRNCRRKADGTACGGCGVCSAETCVPTPVCKDKCSTCNPHTLTCKPKDCGSCGVCNSADGTCLPNTTVCGSCEFCNLENLECTPRDDETEVACGSCGICRGGRCYSAKSTCEEGGCGKCKRQGSGKKTTYVCTSKCRTGQRCCPDGKCIFFDECCADEKQCDDGHCCLKTHNCTIGRGCCPPTRETCGNGQASTCCETSDHCVSSGDVTRCCPKDAFLCGEDCCKNGRSCCNGKCCDGTCSPGGGGVCCPRGGQVNAAADVCCPFGPPCGVGADVRCCDEGDQCCDGVCKETCDECPEHLICGDACCAHLEFCTEDGCCPLANRCPNAGFPNPGGVEGVLCCPGAGLCGGLDVAVAMCCAAGEEICQDGCCPAGMICDGSCRDELGDDIGCCHVPNNAGFCADAGCSAPVRGRTSGG